MEWHLISKNYILLYLRILSYQVHIELQDTVAQLSVIRHEIRRVLMITPGPTIQRLVDNLAPPYTCPLEHS